MQLIIEIPNKQLFDKIVQLLNAFKSEGLKIIEDKPQNKFSEFSGMWKDRDITQESIRKQAWR